MDPIQNFLNDRFCAVIVSPTNSSQLSAFAR